MSSSTVWKYEVPIGSNPHYILLPVGAEILCAREQGGEPHIWVRVDPTARLQIRRAFTVRGTGHLDCSGKYVGTAFCGSYVWHVFEVTK